MKFAVIFGHGNLIFRYRCYTFLHIHSNIDLHSLKLTSNVGLICQKPTNNGLPRIFPSEILILSDSPENTNIQGQILSHHLSYDNVNSKKVLSKTTYY